MPDNRAMGERIVYSEGMCWDPPITKERKMTRSISIVNTSNHPNENYEISVGDSDHTEILRPGGIKHIPLYGPDDEANIHIRVAGDDSGSPEGWMLKVEREE